MSIAAGSVVVLDAPPGALRVDACAIAGACVLRVVPDAGASLVCASLFVKNAGLLRLPPRAGAPVGAAPPVLAALDIRGYSSVFGGLRVVAVSTLGEHVVDDAGVWRRPKM